jgi:hypothetical protein
MIRLVSVATASHVGSAYVYPRQVFQERRGSQEILELLGSGTVLYSWSKMLSTFRAENNTAARVGETGQIAGPSHAGE